MARPVLGILAHPKPVPPSRSLLRSLSAWCDIRAASRLDGSAPCIATSPRASDLGRLLETGDRRVAVMVTTQAEAAEAHAAGAIVIATTPVDDIDVLLPSPSINGVEYPPIAVGTRRQWRQRLGLPEHMVLTATGSDGQEREGVPAPLALCSVAIVYGELALVAMALGTPMVTDAETASLLALRDRVDAVVTEDPGLVGRLAGDLARDENECARLGGSGLAKCLREHDLTRASLDILRRLGIASSASPTGALDERLIELGTPPRSRLGRHLHIASTP